jgi:hypothetical protein
MCRQTARRHDSARGLLEDIPVKDDHQEPQLFRFSCSGCHRDIGPFATVRNRLVWSVMTRGLVETAVPRIGQECHASWSGLQMMHGHRSPIRLPNGFMKHSCVR